MSGSASWGTGSLGLRVARRPDLDVAAALVEIAADDTRRQDLVAPEIGRGALEELAGARVVNLVEAHHHHPIFRNAHLLELLPHPFELDAEVDSSRELLSQGQIEDLETVNHEDLW